ncbi:hypothetical protein [Candidatus Endoriftia persephone]|nr:hypothetical protein [Candidatus Endoriftia persephone]USF87817.1 hypothetical protein L0Y14_00790 [Candidatus Endoriftia persephone]
MRPGAGPHALTSAGPHHTGYRYDQNGNMTAGGGREIQWTSFNKPSRLAKGNHWVEFDYDADRACFRKETNKEQTLYIGKAYERVVDKSTGEVKHKYFVYADNQLVGIHVRKSDSVPVTPKPD